MIKKSISLLCAFIFVFVISAVTLIEAYATDNTNELGIEIPDGAGAIYLYNYESDRVLLSRGGGNLIAPASTAKMMTGLVVCKNYKDKLDSEVTITEEMLSDSAGTSMNLKVDMTVTVKDLLLGTVCGANNDAAQALAVACAGSINAFVKEMNLLADSLYMKSTVYKNPTGLDAAGAVTTLDDSARLAHSAAKNELYVSLSSLNYFEFTPKDGETVTVYNRNALASQFSAAGYTNKYAKGLIAGSTDEGGYVLATYANKDGASYLCVIMGAQAYGGEIYSYATANSILEYAFNRYESVKIAKAGETFLDKEIVFAVSEGEAVKLPLVIENDVYAFVKYDVDVKKDIRYKTYLYTEELSAPIVKGDVVGGVDFYCNGVRVATAPLVAGESVDANPILYFLNDFRTRIFSRTALICFIIFVILTSVYLYFYIKNTRHKKVGTVRFNKFY